MAGHAVVFGVIPPLLLTCNNIKSDIICCCALAIMLWIIECSWGMLNWTLLYNNVSLT
jgi:hypothetical protein